MEELDQIELLLNQSRQLNEQMALLLRVVRNRVTYPSETPPAEPEAFTFLDLDEHEDTSGSETDGSATLTGKGGDVTGGAILYQEVTGGSIQIICKFDGFTEAADNFAFAGIGVRQSTDDGAPMFNLIKHVIGRISAKSRSETDGELVATQGDDTDTAVYWGVTFDFNLQIARAWKAATLADLNDVDVRTLVGEHDLSLTAPYLVYLYAGSNSSSATETASFSGITISDTITLTPPEVEEPTDPDPGEGGTPDLDPTPAFGDSVDATFTGAWPTTDTIAEGWDFTWKPGTTPAALSGVYYFGGQGAPADFPGHELSQTNAQWKTLEPSRGSYNLDWILTRLDAGPCHLNVRGMIKSCVNSAGDPVAQSSISAPAWLSGAGTTTENISAGRIYTNYNLYDPDVKGPLIELIQAIGNSDIPAHPNLKGQILHGVSSSAGEEWTGKQASDSRAINAMLDIIDAWGEAYGEHAGKIAWLKENPSNLFERAVITNGMGCRGGAIESWLRGQYTPGDADETGQILATGGYLETDPDFLIISEGRHWQDQNEVYENYPSDFFMQNHRMANLRVLQMRRNICALPRESSINPYMDNWMGVQLGKNASTADDAWVCLFQSFSGGNGQEINNFERFLSQRDINGVSTTPVLKRDHGKGKVATNNTPSNLHHIFRGRTATTMGFALNSDFMTGGPHDVAIKITYQDVGTGTWQLKYDKTSTNGSRGGLKQITCSGTNRTRTATFFLSDFHANATGHNFDFDIVNAGGNVPFMFVRVCKV